MYSNSFCSINLLIHIKYMLPEIPGKIIKDKYHLDSLRETVARLLDQNGNSRRFPGAQPISFAADHIGELESEDYFVSEKADGIRCLLFTRQLTDGSVETFLIDRKNNYYQHVFGLPMPGLKKPHRHTILDGELVMEKVKGKTELWFLFFDALMVDEKLLVTRGYTSRLGVVTADLI